MSRHTTKERTNLKDLSDDQLDAKLRTTEQNAKRRQSKGQERLHESLQAEKERREQSGVSEQSAVSELAAGGSSCIRPGHLPDTEAGVAELSATASGTVPEDIDAIVEMATDDEGQLLEPNWSGVAQLHQTGVERLIDFYDRWMDEAGERYENAYDDEHDAMLNGQTHKEAAEQYRSAEQIREKLEDYR